MKPTVTLIANYRPDRQHSMLRLAELIEGVLAEQGVAPTVIRPRDRIGRLRLVMPRFEKWLGYVDKFMLFPIELLTHRLTRPRGNHVYHITDHSNAAYSFVLHDHPHVITCNDVLAIRSARGEIAENPTGTTGQVLQWSILSGLRHARRIVCISANTANELQQLLEDRPIKVSSSLLPLNHPFEPMPVPEALATLTDHQTSSGVQISPGFILHVGGNQWYKNRLGACHIYANFIARRRRAQLPCPPLVLAGESPSRTVLQFCEDHADLSIQVIQSPTNIQVQALYSLAGVLLFPSLQEGFGWPIVEAMACGCPVVTTGQPPMTEAGGQAALYMNPRDHGAAADALETVFAWSPEQRCQQVERGYRNVNRFDRASLATHLLDAYRDVLPARTRR
ncbi:MAG: glycosyltransferase [Cyanobacteriota bacterium]|nr:glycosyltransferase [Cyanobacteriota bacterium]